MFIHPFRQIVSFRLCRKPPKPAINLTVYFATEWPSLLSRQQGRTSVFRDLETEQRLVSVLCRLAATTASAAGGTPAVPRAGSARCTTSNTINCLCFLSNLNHFCKLYQVPLINCSANWPQNSTQFSLEELKFIFSDIIITICF